MDPVTHGVVGAMAAFTVSGADRRGSAVVIGASAAMLADVEAFIHIPSDPLFNLEIHRQFTHSLIFIPVGALFAAAIFWLVFRKRQSFLQTYIAAFAGYATHWFMDLITSYGTELLWPFSDTRFALNIVSVVDPVISGGLVVFTALGIWLNRSWLIGVSWGWLFLLLANGWFQNDRAEAFMNQYASERGHTISRSVIKPTIGNQVLWRATYIYGDSIQTDGVRTGFTGGLKLYTGESAPLIQPEVDFGRWKGTTLYQDLIRFKRLSEGYLVHHPEYQDVIGDARYSMLPTSLIPLWGVRIDPSRPESNLSFLYFRDASEEIREPFIDMLLGQDLK